MYSRFRVQVWRIAILASHFRLFLFLTESGLFVVYCFRSPQELLEFCGFMQLSAVSFFSELSRVLWSAHGTSVGNSLVYTSLFLREVIVWSVFPVSALCPAEDLPEIIMFIVPDRGQRGWRQ